MAQTRNVFLTDDTWTDLGEGPALLGAYGEELYYSVGETSPTPDEIGFLARFGSNPVMIPAHARIWARAQFGGRHARAVIATLSGNADGSLAGVSPPSSRNFK
jgi:hypothetical protein